MIAAARKVPPGKTVNQERIRLRNIAILETLQGSGVRVSELVSLRRGDLDRENRRAVVTGKGDKQRLIFVTDEAWTAIWDYLGARGDGAPVRGAGSAPLFARHDRGAGGEVLALTTKSVREVVWTLAQAARLDVLGITPHRFRAWPAPYGRAGVTSVRALLVGRLEGRVACPSRVSTQLANSRAAAGWGSPSKRSSGVVAAKSASGRSRYRTWRPGSEPPPVRAADPAPREPPPGSPGRAGPGGARPGASCAPGPPAPRPAPERPRASSSAPGR